MDSHYPVRLPFAGSLYGKKGGALCSETLQDPHRDEKSAITFGRTMS